MRLGYLLRLTCLTPAGILLIIAVLACQVENGSSTMILGSMLLGSMAANTAMLLGKMSLGGLMMMMMAQQSSNGGGGLASLAGLGSKRSTDGQPSLLGLAQQLGLASTQSSVRATSSKRTTRSHKNGGKHIRHFPQGHAQQVRLGPMEQQHLLQQQEQHQHQPPSHPHHHHHQQQQQQQQSNQPPQALPQDQLGMQLPNVQEHRHYFRRVIRSIVDELRNTSGAGEPITAETPTTTTSTTTTTTTTLPPPPSTIIEEPNSQDDVDDDSGAAAEEAARAQQALLYTRMMRQADSFDYMSCLPKFVCGLEAQPPSKKTSILNDYSHLLKMFFGNEDEVDDELDDDEVPSDEDDPAPDDYDDSVEQYRLSIKDREDLDDKAKEVMINEDPSNLKHVLRDLMHPPSKNNKKRNSHKKRKHGMKQKKRFGDIHGEKPPPNFYPDFSHYHPPPHPPGYYSDDKPVKESSSSGGGLFSSMLPKIKAGFGTTPQDPDFDNDPFFTGFKRSLDLEKVNIPVVAVAVAGEGGDGQDKTKIANPILVLVEDDGQNEVVANKRSKRISDNSRRRRRKRRETVEAIEEMLANDPVIQKYQRAKEIGRQSRKDRNNGRGCTNAFKGCPYNWSQIMGMITNMRDVVIPNNGTKRENEKIVVLQVPSADTKPSGVVTAVTKHGATSMTHDMGNGNVMEITLKLSPKVTGFENVPVLQEGPYIDELSVESLELVPHKPTPPPKKQPQSAAAAESAETDTEEVEEALQKFIAKNNGTWSQKGPKPKRKFKPSPSGSKFQFASDVDVMGVKGGTILPPGGTDAEVKLKTKSKTKNSASSSSSSTSTTEDSIIPIGSANTKNKNKNKNGNNKKKGNNKKPSEEEDLSPAASYKDNAYQDQNPDTSEELDDEESDEDDFGEVNDDEFILDDRKNGRTHNMMMNQEHHQGHQHQLQEDEHQGRPLPMLYENRPKTRPPIRPPPYPGLLMNKSPILFDDSKDWAPIGESARALSQQRK